VADPVLEGIDLPFEQAIAFFRGKALIPTAHWTDVWRTAHAHGFMVAGAATDELLDDFQQSLRKALEQGTTLAEFRKDFDTIVEQHGWAYNGTPGWRSSIIYDTNLSTAYSAGRYAQLTDPDALKAFPYWTYVHGDSQRPRPQHLAWNAQRLALFVPRRADQRGRPGAPGQVRARHRAAAGDAGLDEPAHRRGAPGADRDRSRVRLQRRQGVEGRCSCAAGARAGLEAGRSRAAGAVAALAGGAAGPAGQRVWL
jgi:Phage Mu protein F like protein